jgi:hypothetical protein
MRKTLPTVKPLIEALQLADPVVRRRFRVVGAYLSLGPSRTEDLGFPDWAQRPTAHPASCGVRRVAAPLLLA